MSWRHRAQTFTPGSERASARLLRRRFGSVSCCFSRIRSATLSPSSTDDDDDMRAHPDPPPRTTPHHRRHRRHTVVATRRRVSVCAFECCVSVVSCSARASTEYSLFVRVSSCSSRERAQPVVVVVCLARVPPSLCQTRRHHTAQRGYRPPVTTMTFTGGVLRVSRVLPKMLFRTSRHVS